MRDRTRHARVDERDRLATDEVRVHEAVEGDTGRYRHLEREPERVDGGGDLHGECPLVQEYWMGDITQSLLFIILDFSINFF